MAWRDCFSGAYVMILPILKITDPDKMSLAVMRETAVDVTEFNKQIRSTVASMIETLLAGNGTGLAAPQIGRNLNVFVMRMHTELPNSREVRVVINPKTVTEAGDDAGTPNEKLEGCLSIPGVLGRVNRFYEVVCIYWDERGKRHTESLKGMQARIYQHEWDHLCGVLFVDRANAFYPVGHRFVEEHRTTNAAGV